ncbi:MAG: serine/threonine protein kinase [Pirellulaceae bacterium]|nr:serine/threonine protein kinase [Pirellulaceae bacterium]
MQKETIVGSYRIDGQLGRGGMGTVYKVTHEDTHEVAALKMLSPDLAHEENLRDRFYAEIEALKQLKHPGIVQLYGYGEYEGNLYYVMQLAEGESLQKKLHARHQFRWEEVLEIGRQICLALRHAHDRGIVHRDLKPANLLITKENKIKLLDFGIAKLFGVTHLTTAGGVLGTIDYMSPEQAEGKAVTPLSDLYSLGCVLYCLLAGRPPFHANSLPEIVEKIRHQKPTRISYHVAEIPEAFEKIIHRLLAKKGNERILTAQAAYKRLGEVPLEIQRPPAQKGEAAGQSRIVTVGTPPDDGKKKPRPEKEAGQGTAGKGYPKTERQEASDSIEHTLQATQAIVSADTDVDFVLDSPSAMQSKRAKFTRVSESELGGRDEEWYQQSTSWLAIGTLCLLFILMVGGGWYLMQPLSEEDLYQKIVTEQESGNLLELEDEVETFLEHYPHSQQAQEITNLQSVIKQQLYRQNLERRQNTSRSISPLERLYLDATEKDRSREESREALLALRNLLAHQDKLTSEQERLGEVVSERLVELEQEPKVPEGVADFFKDQANRVRQIAPENRRAARELLASLQTLYGHEEWAQEELSLLSRLLR